MHSCLLNIPPSLSTSTKTALFDSYFPLISTQCSIFILMEPQFQLKSSEHQWISRNIIQRIFFYFDWVLYDKNDQ